MSNRLILNEISYHGNGASEKLGEEIKIHNLKKAFFCFDSGLSEIGLPEEICKNLSSSGIEYEEFSSFKPNPTVNNVQRGVDLFNKSGCDCIVALGGGSAIDVAKAIGIIAANPEFYDVTSLEGVVNTKNKSVPLFAVPTTAGTAAEVTINYVITDEERNVKLVCVDPNSIPAASFVDPKCMKSMPPALTAATGMDALTHAIEGYLTQGAWELTDMFHLKAIELISRSLRSAVKNNEKGREDMALGQYVAGMGFSNAGLGLVHAMAHPLGALYDTPHGIANAIILPAVMEFNAPSSGEKYRDIAKAMGIKNTDIMTPDQFRQAAVDAVRTLSHDIKIPAKLTELIKEADIDFLSKSAYNDICRSGNPRNVTIDDIKEIYTSLL